MELRQAELRQKELAGDPLAMVMSIALAIAMAIAIAPR